MREHPFTILSTASLPFGRTAPIPEDIRIVVIPFIRIIPRPNIEIKPLIAEYALQNEIVVFTSAHAVKIVADSLKEKPDWKIYCIRNETRQAVETHFGKESIANFSSNAIGLSKCMIADGVQKALFFCGDKRLNILPDHLNKHGIRLTEMIIYDTHLTPVQLEEQPDAILFFSPSAVNSFFSKNRLPSEIRVFAMGASTAKALEEFHSVPPVISTESDKALVLNMAVEYAKSHSYL